jgi:hypothetical protein
VIPRIDLVALIAAARISAQAGDGRYHFNSALELSVGVKKTGKGRRKLGRKKRRMRSRIRHRK